MIALHPHHANQQKGPIRLDRAFLKGLPSSDLLSQDPAVQVPSALESLTSVFGMGTGVASPPLLLDMKLDARCVTSLKT